MNFPLVTEFLKQTSDEGLKKELQQLLKFAEKAVATITEIIGNVFIKTATIIAGTVPVKGTTIKSLLKSFEKAANDRGIANVHIDSDITGWFPKAKVREAIAGSGRLLRFVKNITHASIIKNCKQLNVYQEFDLSDGIQRATALVAAGELDEKNNKGVVIYLTDKKDGRSCRLSVWRRGFGRLGLNVDEVDLGRGWDAGYSVLARNENLD